MLEGDMDIAETLYSRLSLFKYHEYLRNVRKLIRAKALVAEFNNIFVYFELDGQMASYRFLLDAGEETSDCDSISVSKFPVRKKDIQELVTLFARAEVNARLNKPIDANNYQVLELGSIGFSRTVTKAEILFRRKINKPLI